MRIRTRWLAATSAVSALLLAAQAAQASEEGGASALFGDLGQALAAVVVFLGLLAVIGKWGWRPVVEQLRRREQSIAQTISNAQQQEQAAQQLLEQYRKQLELVQAQAKETLDAARKEGAAAREQLLAIARDETSKAARQAAQDIQRAKQDALRELYDATAELAADVALRVMEGRLSQQDRRQLVSQSLEEIRRQVSGSR